MEAFNWSLGPYSPGNVAWAKEQGFTNMILGSGPGRNDSLNAMKITDSEVEQVKGVLKQNGMHVSALQVGLDAINPDTAKRDRSNEYFVKAIELAGNGFSSIGTQSGKDASRVFRRRWTRLCACTTRSSLKPCEANKVRILREPYPEAANIATSAVGFRALFKAFGDSPYVGLQYDPSHLVRQFMDPVETSREFVDKIYDVHLKDTEILWPVLRAGGINPVDGARWWRYRIPGMGSVDWRGFFSVLQEVGYQGAMSIEQEDDLYGPDHNPGPDFGRISRLGM